MKKNILILLLLTVGLMTVMGQGRGRNSHDTAEDRAQHQAEMQSMKIAFITEALALTPEEAQKYWPVYNKYWEKRVEISQKRQELYQSIAKSAVATAAQANQMVELLRSEASEMANFIAEITQVLSADKAAKTFSAEEGFKHQLMRRTRVQATK